MSIISSPVDVLGIVGGILILLGFYRITSGKWTSKSVWYELDNLAGASLLAIYQLYHEAYITVVINVVYASVAIMGLNSYAQRKAVISKKRRKTAH